MFISCYLFPMKSLLQFWLFLVAVLASFSVIDVVLVSGQCQSDQETLLLEMKNSLIFNHNSSTRLAQWSQGTDCCKWSGVICDRAGHVTDLNLQNESISGAIENSSGLFGLQYLQSLNLAHNSLNGAEIPSGLAKLTNLAYLNLSSAGFGGQIPSVISHITNLVTLDLSIFTLPGNPMLKLENPNLTELIRNLTVLKELHLDGVNISANGIEWCQALSSSLPNLQVLSLSNCFLSGSIHPSLSKLQSLSVIHLDQNNLSSSVPEFFADFSNLTSLQFSSCELSGKFPGKIFQAPTLHTLDLSGNELLQGSLPNFPQKMSLQTLILSQTNFSGTIPESIDNLKSLLRIELAHCKFTGKIPTSIENLTQLIHLDLSSNRFSGHIPSFHTFTNLTYLDLSSNFLAGEISSIDWEKLLNLVQVDLRNNLLFGRIPQSLFTLPWLAKLQLANNHFEGPVPEFPNPYSSVLNTLDLSTNRLEGPIPMSVFELQNIQVLVLSSNKFNGTLQINRRQKLTRLDLSYNSLTVKASSINSTVLPQIGTLRLASCNLTMIPNLRNVPYLFHLDLSINQIPGDIPNWIWHAGDLSYLNVSHNLLKGMQQPYSIPNLSILDIHSNQLQGKMPQPPSTVVYMDYSRNNFTSSIPADIGKILSFTIFISLSNNFLTGTIPDSLCNAKNLKVLDLSHNNLSGTIPQCLTAMDGNIGVLNLRGNNFKGIISDTFPRPCQLRTLDFSGNQLEGSIPKSLANCEKLEVLNLGNNQINDTFPCWLKYISRLRVLVLRSNKFHGDIFCPEGNLTWPLLQIIDLASNNFSGRLPRKWLTTWETMMIEERESQARLHHLRFEFLGLSQLYYVDEVTVTAKGLEMELAKILTLFTSIDLSSNNFQGAIPEEIGLLNLLYVLNLSHNALTGPIPSSIRNLRQLESLDISVNNLIGEIPSQLASLSFLSFLNVSYNNLMGKIPSGSQLQLLTRSSFEGNEGLCGPPLNDCITNSSNLPPSSPDSSNDSNELDLSIIMATVGFVIGFGAAVASLMYSVNANKWYDDRIQKFLKAIRR